MLALNSPLQKSAESARIIPVPRPASLLRFALLFVLLATPLLLSLVPSQGTANYLLSVQVGEHSYALPASCESLTATLTHCTAVGTLPLSSETSSSLIKAKAKPLQGSSEGLECRGGPSTFNCRSSLTQRASITKH
jgi:hypothetical protein